MLIRLTGEQASNYWDFIKEGLEAALPPVVGMQSDRMSNILGAVLSGSLTIWVSTNKEKDNTIDGFCATSINTDAISGTKSLLIYAVYGINSVDQSWKNGMKTVREYAQGQGCHRILAYSDVPSILAMVERLGGDTKYRLISLPL